MKFKAPYLSYEEIRKLSENFICEYNFERRMPVPIEDIIEFHLGIDIVPCPNLKKDMDTEGFLSKDLSTIYIDQNLQEKFEFRYRFTLAHEVGHLVLHKEFYQQASYGNSVEWSKLIDSIDPKEYSWFESQAYNFAGLVLVPKIELLLAVEDTKTLKSYFEESGLMQDTEMIEIFFNQVAMNSLSEKFNVSEMTISKRLQREKISL